MMMGASGVDFRNAFEFSVQTDNTGVSSDDQFTLPLFSGETYDIWVSWGDGTYEHVTSWAPKTHTYSSAGLYTIKMTGEMPRLSFYTKDPSKLVSVLKWGNNQWQNMAAMFRACGNMNIDSGAGVPDLSNSLVPRGVSFGNMFYESSVNQDVSAWDTSAVYDMSGAFREATSFDQDIGDWDITSLDDATSMFVGVALSTANYDALLIGWEAQSVNNGVDFHAGNSTYTGGGDAAAARAALIADHSWNITDGGIA